MDRTPFEELLLLVEKTVESENLHAPNRPIYLVGESIGGCLALAVAARNPDLDLMLILANPATSFTRSQLQLLLPVLEAIPKELYVGFSYIYNLATGDPLRMMMATVQKQLSLQQTVGELSENLAILLPALSAMADILPRESLLWKMQMLKSASAFVNSCIHAVKAEALILASGKDQLLPSQEEAERLNHVLPSCRIRNFTYSGHCLFMEEGFDLLTAIKGAGFYRRAKNFDYVSDFVLPIASEFCQAQESYGHHASKWVHMVASPVIFSTLENGSIVRNLAGVPEEGPVLLIGNHMLFGSEMGPMFTRFMTEKNVLLRAMAHPSFFSKTWELILPDSSFLDVYRHLGAVPVSATNFYKLLSAKSHVLLYPGGARESLHRKEEAYKLFWPLQPEFVRMAARFGTKIVPFGCIGEDDIFDLFLDYNDLIKIPYLKAQIEELNNELFQRLRADTNEEVAKQDLHLPIILPKLPGRFYCLFGKPIDTAGPKAELRNKEKAHELYLHVKTEVERNISYLKEKREKDPYRSILSRVIYQAINGSTPEIPTFEF